MGKASAKIQGKSLADSLSKARKSRWITVLVVLIGLVIVLIISRKTREVSPENISAIVSTDTTPAMARPQDFEAMLKQLEGRWQRTDGGYIIELSNPTPDGKIAAAYFNPNPINVGRSIWQNNAGKIIVTVELQDVNYPGSLYTLEFHPNENFLVGTYYQAVEKVNYNVEFRRLQ